MKGGISTPSSWEVRPTEQWWDTKVSGRTARAIRGNIGHHGVRENGDQEIYHFIALALIAFVNSG